ncbi:hypothetical protein MVEN_00009000 [Mycena venus]|uniref:DUF6532 domain-containing protein n=1 Tax=Mycena venus TaxID=2733690 RepID=A0A8H6Z9A0_9AGAR|nr:hypothetical protein MVEN_00009000 [Mycena venus]
MAQQSLHKSTSTYASVTVRGHSMATNVTMRPSATNVADIIGDKENLRRQNPARQSHGTKAYAPTPKQSRVQDRIEESDDDEHDADGDYAAPAEDESMHDHGNDDDKDADEEEDKASPVRGHTRRMSEKQAQLFEEQHQAEERKHEKALKAAKAAKKKAGVIEPDSRGPIQDDSFTSRTLTDTRPMATKNLAQRNSRVPAPAKFPSPDWREDTTRRDRDGHYASLSSQTLYISARSSLYRVCDLPRPGGSDRVPALLRDLIPSVDEVLYRHLGKLGPQFAILTEGLFQTRFPSTISEPSHEPPHPHENRVQPRNSLQLVSEPTRQPRHTSCHPHSDLLRSHSPDVGDRRRRSTSFDSDDLRPTQTAKTTTSSGRPRAKDLDDQAKEYTICAIDRYRCFISAKQFFTDHTTEPVLVHHAWDETCEELGERIPLTRVIYKLIANRGPQCRGELKTKVRPLAEIMFGFKSGHNKKDINFNRTHAENLKDGARLAFKDPENKKGLFKHPILQKACNTMWFANRRDEGPSHSELFNPLPEEALAALLTVTENTIDEYLTGIRTNVPFTANEYRPVYETHLQSLREFREHTAKYNLLDKILTRMHNVGRFHSGAQPITTAPTSVLSKDVLDAALKDWEEDSETESEGEDGEHSE